MKKVSLVFLTLSVVVIGIHFSCQQQQTNNLIEVPVTADAESNYQKPNWVRYAWNHTSSDYLVNRHSVPKGFKLTKVDSGSFGEFLRFLPMKPKGTPIRLYNGKKKTVQVLNAGVLDIDVGETDLQQCADAVMRLRAEYLYSVKKFKQIHFNYTSGFKAEYSKWRDGNKIGVKGNNVYYYQKSNSSDKTYAGFRKYLWNVYNYAGTYSLNKELVKQSPENLKEGDVVIIGGFPGHVVMVAAVAENSKKEKAVLLIQSYMPAQNIHIVKKQFASGDGVWFKVEDLKKSGWKTWEFDYEVEHLKTWRE